MATRFYYSTTVWPDISPDLSSLWEKSDSPSTGNALVTAPESNTNFWSSLQDIDPVVNPLPCKCGAYSFVSPPLAAQTISGTVKGQMLADEWTAGSGFCRSVIIRVLSGDGITERGVLLAHFLGALVSEFPESADNAGDGHPTFQNRSMPPETALNPVACQEDDVIVVELGMTRFAVGDPGIDDGSQIGEIWAYSQGNGDLPEDETTVVSYGGDLNPANVPQLDPWIEFSQDIAFYVEGLASGQGAATTGSPAALASGIAAVMGTGAATTGEVSAKGAKIVQGSGQAVIPFPAGLVFGIEEAIGAGAAAIEAPFAAAASPASPLPQCPFAAAGNITISGEAAYDTSSPGVSEFTAGGSISVAGPCTLTVTTPALPKGSQFAGAGCIVVTGPCQVNFAGVLPPAEFAAAGYISIDSPGQCEVLTPGASEFAAAGSLKVCGAAQLEVVTPAALVSAFAAAGTIEVTGICRLDSPSSLVTALVANTGLGAPVVLVSANCAMGALYPPVAAFRASGSIFIVNPDAVLAEIFDTWALSGQTYEPSFFTGFNFNSYAVHQGKAYAAGADGIYLLEGADDDGVSIQSGMRVGPHNFGTDRQKRLRALRLGDCGEAVRVKVSTGENAGTFKVDRGRAVISRDLQGREFTLEFVDFAQLSQLEITPLILAAR